MSHSIVIGGGPNGETVEGQLGSNRPQDQSAPNGVVGSTMLRNEDVNNGGAYINARQVSNSVSANITQGSAETYQPNVNYVGTNTGQPVAIHMDPVHGPIASIQGLQLPVQQAIVSGLIHREDATHVIETVKQDGEDKRRSTNQMEDQAIDDRHDLQGGNEYGDQEAAQALSLELQSYVAEPQIAYAQAMAAPNLEAVEAYLGGAGVPQEALGRAQVSAARAAYAIIDETGITQDQYAAQCDRNPKATKDAIVQYAVTGSSAGLRAIANAAKRG